MFQTNKIYIQVFRNKVTVVNLQSGAESTSIAMEPFSTKRSVLSSFGPADKAVRTAMKDVGLKFSFLKTRGAIQQMEDTDGGLTDIEKRALRDLAENADVGVVYIIDGEQRLTNDDALRLLEKRNPKRSF
jgi:rod shape-determining protein MreB